MASPKVQEALAQAQGATDQTAALKSLLSNLKTISTPQTVSSDFKTVADNVFPRSALGMVAQNSILEAYIAALQSFDDADLTIEIGQHVLNHISSQSHSFVEQGAKIRELMADAHESKEDNLEAAKLLAEIPLDNSQRRVTHEDRAEIWVRIARNYLEIDDTTSAESYLNKLRNIMYKVSDPTLNLHFKLSQARIQDSKREFLSSSQAYHDISFSPAISEEERLHTLSMAVKCAILAPAGPLRSRTLGRLYKDERSTNLEEFTMLEKMFFDRLLAPAEVEKFAQGLSPHQLATTSDGSTVLAKAVVEHNLLGASRLYTSIGFDALGTLLGLDAERAEDTTSRMIEQGRLVGSIDQIEQVIYFENREASGEKGSGRAEVTIGKESRRWDANVESLAEEVENITNALQREFPDFVTANLMV